MKDIEIFTGPSCRYCEAAKKLLNERKLSYIERDVSDPAVLEEFRERLPRVKSIPQIFIDSNHVGGFEDLQMMLG